MLSPAKVWRQPNRCCFAMENTVQQNSTSKDFSRKAPDAEFCIEIFHASVHSQYRLRLTLQHRSVAKLKTDDVRPTMRDRWPDRQKLRHARHESNDKVVSHCRTSPQDT